MFLCICSYLSGGTFLSGDAFLTLQMLLLGTQFRNLSITTEVLV